MRFLVSFLLFACMAAAHAQSPAERTFRDQHGRADGVPAHRGSVVLVLLITAERLRHLKLWEVKLRDRYADLSYLRIADIPAAPPLSEAQVATKLAGRVPKDIAVLLDMERSWATEFSLDTRYPNLLLFDRAGRLRARFRGPVSDDFVEVVAEQIDAVLEQP